MISDDKFKKAYCDQSRALGRIKFLLHEQRSKEIDFTDLKNPLIIVEKKLLPLSNSHVIGSHDRLLLLYTHKAYDTFILWNPSIRQHKIFVCPYLNNTFVLPNACGLCYDSRTDDYKIILIYESFYVVCYANKNFWMIKENIPILELEPYLHECCEGVSTSGGYVYWCRSDSRLFQYVSEDSTVIRFNAKSDELEEFSLPEFICQKELYVLSTFNGCLGSNVWIMEQDEWKCLAKILRFTVRDSFLAGCTKDREVIIFERKRACVFIFNPRNQTLVRNSFTSNNFCSECMPRGPTCLDSLSFLRLDHLQYEAL